jgi:Ca2+-binding RTX toxin-like protein
MIVLLHRTPRTADVLPMRIAFHGLFLSAVLFSVSVLQPAAHSAAGLIPYPCTFDAESATVTVDTGTSGFPTLTRSGDALETDGIACETATVTNTDTILVRGSGSIYIDLAQGPFAPGLTDEGDGSSEIEFAFPDAPAFPDAAQQIGIGIYGSTSNDAISLRTRFEPIERTSLAFLDLNLNADEASSDADLSLPMYGFGFFTMSLRAGDDRLETEGAWGRLMYGVGGWNLLWIQLGQGDDYALGGADVLDAQRGFDTIDVSSLDQAFDVVLDLGDYPERSPVLMFDDTESTPARFERAFGHDGHDVLIGGRGDSTLHGLGGPDVLVGLHGDDWLAGGDGADDLRGHRGRDRLIGGLGADLLRGGPDSDRCSPVEPEDTPTRCEH